MGPTATLLQGGTHLHLQHGPIDLVIGAYGARRQAFAAARLRFATVLEELVAELPDLRARMCSDTQVPSGAVARRMHAASAPHCEAEYLTRMAAVAGAVADEILDAMVAAADLRCAFVNNGGDIALHLGEGESFTAGMMDHAGHPLGRISIDAADRIGGIATSGRHGRSLSFGIADSVTVLARNAAQADVAATLVANVVDLPRHPAIQRRPACDITDDSDLGALPVVTGCGKLSTEDCETALAVGVRRATLLTDHGSINGAALFLQGHAFSTSGRMTMNTHRDLHHA